MLFRSVADAAHNATARYVLGASGKSWNKIDLATNVLTQSVDLRIDGTNLASTTLRLESAAATTNSNLPLATTLQWHAESVDTYASNAQYDAAPALSSGTIGFAVFKVATAPTIGAGGLIELNDGGSKTVVLPTLSGLGSGELVSYRLSEVPEWLRPSGATLVSTDATTHLSVYSLPLASGTNAASLQFVAIGSNLRSAQTASFKIAAFSTEAGSGDTARSAEVIESVKVNPVVTTPTLLGPKLLQIDEGGTATLAGVKAFITPGDSAEVLSTIDVMFAANVRGADVAGATLDVSLNGGSLAARSELISGKTWYHVTPAELSAVQIRFADSGGRNDVSGSIALDLKASQIFRDGSNNPIASSSTATLSSVITVAPVADTPNIVVPSAGLVMGERGSAVIEGLSIASPDPSETASGTLTINQGSGFILQKAVNGVWVDQSPSAITSGSVTFRIDASTLSAKAYRINASGYFDGDIRIDVAASAVENPATWARSEEHTSELQSRLHLVCRLLLEKKMDGYLMHILEVAVLK